LGRNVVYKIDRLTRSLADFAKIVETLNTTGAADVDPPMPLPRAEAAHDLSVEMSLRG
jgi:hypothetical protein